MVNPVPKHLRLFSVAKDGTAILRHHSQASTARAKQTGYIVLRLEPWVEKEHPGFTEFLVASLNGGGE